jgi:hypothetical protein
MVSLVTNKLLPDFGDPKLDICWNAQSSSWSPGKECLMNKNKGVVYGRLENTGNEVVE